MARRSYNSYFVTEKWVYDKAARRVSKKAQDALDGAERHLMSTGVGYGDVPFWQELAEEDAFDVLARARKAVEAAEDAAHKAAKAREER